jgi:DNA-binding response OmpR family regulator
VNAPAQPEAVVVEDDEDIGRLLKFILEREGYRVTLYPDGRAASERLATAEVPALVVLDVMLPYVNGHQLLNTIRASGTWKAVPVLMLTAKSGETDVVRALDGGASDYLTKPFQPAELKARVRRLVAKA